MCVHLSSSVACPGLLLPNIVSVAKSLELADVLSG
jgi:hypothetical protein